MRFADYQQTAATTCLPHCFCGDYLKPGLLNEAGEICGKIKKIVRQDIQLDNSRFLIAAEIGDVLWYAAMWAELKGVDTKDIVLSALPVHPYRPFIPYMEETAADIVAGACMFRMAATRSQLEGLLVDLGKLANAIGFTMVQVAEINVEKLASRKERDKIQGAGDVR